MCPYYKVIWKATISMIVKVFLWLILKNKIHIGTNLATKGWHISLVCSLCSTTKEMNQHVFLQCPFAKSLLHILKIQLKIRGWLSTLHDMWMSW